MPVPVAVLGAGSFGTCLALLCARQHDVAIWARNPEIADAINRDRHNPRYLTDVELPENVRATADLAEATAGRELVICAVPSHGVRDVMSEASGRLDPGAIVLSTVKGIEVETGLTMHGVLEDVLEPVHHPRIVCLSGPSFAREIADKRPTVVTVASRQEAYAVSVQTTLSCPWFRCYSHDDVIGVELGGALKNVIAIAVGMSDGLGLGQNARAALMTRGLAEITRLGVRLGANPLTFLGLSGMGDLLLTCTGDLSRHRRSVAQPQRGVRARPGAQARRHPQRHEPGRRRGAHDARGLCPGAAPRRRAADRRDGAGRSGRKAQRSRPRRGAADDAPAPQRDGMRRPRVRPRD
jgi:glycerol-3-phosphate dehydrogenase (NAD(P)+)